ncbi:MAG: hypothetical protein Q9218_008383, partial [Villophora microphyllina]
MALGLIAGKGSKETTHPRIRTHRTNGTQGFERQCNRFTNSSIINNRTSSNNNHNHNRTARFEDFIKYMNNYPTVDNTKVEGTAPIMLHKPVIWRLTEEEKLLYKFILRGPEIKHVIRGPGQLECDEKEKNVLHKHILAESRQRYEALLARQKELPD